MSCSFFNRTIVIVILVSCFFSTVGLWISYHLFRSSNIFETAVEEIIKESRSMMQDHNVNIYYTNDDKKLLPLTKETLNNARRVNANILHDHTTSSLDLIFFSSQKEIEKFSKLKDITGFYSEQQQLIGILPEKKKSLKTFDEEAIYSFQSLFIHEYTHFAFHQKLKKLKTNTNVYPLWFHEGLAEWVANYQLQIKQVSFSVVPFNKLKTDKQWQDARITYLTDVYLQSFYMINELARKHGERIIEKIIKETATYQNFEKGFQKATNQSLGEFEKKFKQRFEIKKTTSK